MLSLRSNIVKVRQPYIFGLTSKQSRAGSMENSKKQPQMLPLLYIQNKGSNIETNSLGKRNMITDLD
jgi:hypothetical protein